MLKQIVFILNKVYGLLWEIPKILQVCNLEILHTICLGFKHGYYFFNFIITIYVYVYVPAYLYVHPGGQKRA